MQINQLVRSYPYICFKTQEDTMFRNTYQSGFLSILYSIGCVHSCCCHTSPISNFPSIDLYFYVTGVSPCKFGTRKVIAPSHLPSLLLSAHCLPLQFTVRNGHIKRITDPDIQSSVLEIMGTNVSTTFIQCPADPKKTLGIKLPFLVMIIKNVSEHS